MPTAGKEQWVTATRLVRGVRGVLVAGLLILVLPAGCGYSARSLYFEDVDTVVVMSFTSRAVMYPDAEFRLTEAIKKKIERQTPYKVTDSRNADTILEGQITDVRQAVLSRARTVGTVRETEVELTIDFVWRDRRSGEVLRERRGLVQVGRYLPTRETAQTLDFGLDMAVDRMADTVVSLMRRDWERP